MTRPEPRKEIIVLERWSCPRGHMHTSLDKAQACIDAQIRGYERAQRREVVKSKRQSLLDAYKEVALRKQKPNTPVLQEGPFAGLPKRLFDILQIDGIKEPGDLAGYSVPELLRTPRLGRVSLGQLALWFEKQNLPFPVPDLESPKPQTTLSEPQPKEPEAIKFYPVLEPPLPKGFFP